MATEVHRKVWWTSEGSDPGLQTGNPAGTKLEVKNQTVCFPREKHPYRLWLPYGGDFVDLNESSFPSW